MNDLIRRQAAIEALTEYWNGISDRHPTLDGEMAVYADCKGIIKRLPSAGPERKKGEVEQTEQTETRIFNAVMHRGSAYTIWTKSMACIFIIEVSYDRIETMPIRRKDCKHFNNGDCTELPKICSENDYCSRAERGIQMTITLLFAYAAARTLRTMSALSGLIGFLSRDIINTVAVISVTG